MAIDSDLVAQSGDAILAIVLVLLYLAVIVLVIAGMLKTFEKANQPGWGCIVPVYNVILLLKVAGKPISWLILMIIPIVGLIPAALIPLAIAKNFGQRSGFGLGLILLPFIFYPILGFGDAEYDPETPAF